ncbi:hypothetical protein [Hyalangium versicolor]|uniref:hypothetical protein n=1 Tax=Hyalangium versicolor TaxID=2861190 RepID=UPI001CCE1010|nr:hypothetical protein [Hyalangium versicolor]
MRADGLSLGSWSVALVALASLAACAPATMSPMVMRMGPGNPEDSTIHGGLRAGPRLSAPLADRTSPSGVDSFSGNRAPFSTHQWSLAYDFAVTKPIDEKFSLHLGVQGEFYYPVPLPGYGLYAGVSSWYGTKTLGVAPALVVRGATDFGLDTRGGPGSIIGAEASASMYFSPEDRVAVGLVPFFGVHRVSSEGANTTSLYYGGAMVLQFPLGRKDRLELSGGFGQVKERGQSTWNSPIIGARWER